MYIQYENNSLCAIGGTQSEFTAYEYYQYIVGDCFDQTTTVFSDNGDFTTYYYSDWNCTNLNSQSFTPATYCVEHDNTDGNNQAVVTYSSTYALLGTPSAPTSVPTAAPPGDDELPSDDTGGGSNSNSSGGNDSPTLSTGGIVGVVIGCLVGVFVLKIVLDYWIGQKTATSLAAADEKKENSSL